MPRSDKVFPDGKENLLAALPRPGPDHGRGPASVVGPGAHLAAGGILLVGGIQERLVSVVCRKRVCVLRFRRLRRFLSVRRLNLSS